MIRKQNSLRGGSRAAATSKMERFVIIVNGWKLHLGCCSSLRFASDSCNPNDILKSAKNFNKKTLSRETTSKTATSDLLIKILYSEKISKEQFYFCEAEISVISIKHYKHFFSNELLSIFLGFSSLCHICHT